MEKPKFRIRMTGKGKIREFQCLEKLNFRIPMFGKAKLPDSSDWKS